MGVVFIHKMSRQSANILAPATITIVIPNVQSSIQIRDSDVTDAFLDRFLKPQFKNYYN